MMMLLLTNCHANDDDDDTNAAKRINSLAIDADAYSSVLSTNQFNCQPGNDVENIGLQCNNKYNNGQTISINFEQTKMQVRQYDICLKSGGKRKSTSATVTQEKPQHRKCRFNAHKHLNKMHLIALFVVYLVTFNAQLTVARPNVDRNSNSDTNSQNVALTSENKVSKCKFY